MTPEQAWQILNGMAQMVRANLEEHRQIQQALQILKPKQKEVPKEKE